MLLAAGAALHYGWALAPAEHQAQVWNILGAVARAALLVLVVARLRSRMAWAVAAWWLAEEAMVAGCSALYILRPWPVAPGQGQCSALLQLDIGILGAAAITALLVAATARVDRYRDG